MRLRAFIPYALMILISDVDCTLTFNPVFSIGYRISGLVIVNNFIEKLKDMRMRRNSTL